MDYLDLNPDNHLVEVELPGILWEECERWIERGLAANLEEFFEEGVRGVCEGRTREFNRKELELYMKDSPSEKRELRLGQTLINLIDQMVRVGGLTDRTELFGFVAIEYTEWARQNAV